MEQVKKGLITLGQVCLWLMFLCAVNDPGMLGARPADSIYNTYSFLLQPLYTVGGYLIMPVQWVFLKVGLYHPELVGHSWFPVSTAATFSALVTPMGLGSFFTPTLFQGTLIWWVPITSVVLSMVGNVGSYVFDRGRNWFWNVMIEYIFQRKKAKLYQRKKIKI
jgi:hypothetical protein